MGRDYSGMMDAAANLQDFSGYLDTEDLKNRERIEAEFRSARNRFVYELLQEDGDWKALQESVADELDEIKAASDPSWAGPIDYVRENLLPKIEQEARKSPWLRKSVRWAPVALGVLAVCAYFGVRLFSGVEISQPIETAAGLKQRAAAVQKVIRYDEWMSTRVRRGGWIKGLLLWPIEPTEAETRGAQELVSVALDGHAALMEQGQICDAPVGVSNNALSDEQIEMVGIVAAHLRSDDTQWKSPPVLTVLDPIRRQFAC